MVGRSAVQPAQPNLPEARNKPTPSAVTGARKRTVVPLQKVNREVSSFIYRRFYVLGGLISDRPGTTMAVCMVITAICCSGFVFLNPEERPEYLYTPQNTESFANRDIFKHHFQKNRISIQVFVEAVPGADLLSREALQEMLELHKAIISTSINVGDQQSKPVTFLDVCSRAMDSCRNTSALTAWEYSASRIALDKDINKTISEVVAGVTGIPEYSVKLLNGKPVSYYMSYLITYLHKDTEQAAITKALTLRIHDTINAFPRDIIRSSGFSQEYLDHEAKSALSSDTMNMAFGYMALNIFTSLSFLRLNPVYNLSFNGAISIGGIALALASAFGLAAFFAPFSQAVKMLPYLLVGIGVDDSFIIVGELRNVDMHLRLPTKERISKTLGRAGAAVLVTSLTDFFAFISGVGSSVPAIQQASLYAAFGVMFDFLYQCTFFVAGLVYKGKAQEAQRYFPHCCLTIPDDAKDSVCLPGKTSRKYDPGVPLPMERIARDLLAPVVLHPLGRMLILVAGVALTAVSAWQVPKVVTDFNYEWFPALDSPIREAVLMRDFHLGGQLGSGNIVGGHEDYFSPASRQRLLEFCKGLTSRRIVEGKFCWIERFHDKVLIPAEANGFDLTSNITRYYSALCDFNEALQSRDGLSWGLNGVKLNSCKDRDFNDAEALEVDPPIIASKLAEIYTVGRSSAEQVAAMNEIKNMAKELQADFKAFAYHYSFLIYEGYEAAKYEILKTSIIACACVFFTTLIILADVLSAIQVFMCVLAVEIWLVGFMGMVGFSFNAVTCINIVFSIGLAVDFTMHITHAYLHAAGTRQERVHKALSTMGPSIINGALSTQIGLFGMMGSSSYVFRVFFIMFTATTVSGAFFGLAFMPALLSLAGSGVVSVGLHSDDETPLTESQALNSDVLPKIEIQNQSESDGLLEVPQQQALPEPR